LRPHNHTTRRYNNGLTKIDATSTANRLHKDKPPHDGPVLFAAPNRPPLFAASFQPLGAEEDLPIGQNDSPRRDCYQYCFLNPFLSLFQSEISLVRAVEKCHVRTITRKYERNMIRPLYTNKFYGSESLF